MVSEHLCGHRLSVDTTVSKLERQDKDEVLLAAVFRILASQSKVVVLSLVKTC